MHAEIILVSIDFKFTVTFRQLTGCSKAHRIGFKKYNFTASTIIIQISIPLHDHYHDNRKWDVNGGTVFS